MKHVCFTRFGHKLNRIRFIVFRPSRVSERNCSAIFISWCVRCATLVRTISGGLQCSLCKSFQSGAFCRLSVDNGPHPLHDVVDLRILLVQLSSRFDPVHAEFLTQDARLECQPTISNCVDIYASAEMRIRAAAKTSSFFPENAQTWDTS